MRRYNAKTPKWKSRWELYCEVADGGVDADREVEICNVRIGDFSHPGDAIVMFNPNPTRWWMSAAAEQVEEKWKVMVAREKGREGMQGWKAPGLVCRAVREV